MIDNNLILGGIFSSPLWSDGVGEFCKVITGDFVIVGVLVGSGNMSVIAGKGINVVVGVGTSVELGVVVWLGV
jgi:hypothetical protein